MRILHLWRRASGEALRLRRPAAAPGAGKSWQKETKLFCDGDVWRQLQPRQLKRGYGRTSDCCGSGAVAGFHLLHPVSVRQFRLSSSFSAAADPEVGEHADDGFLHVLRCEIIDLEKKALNITARKPPKSWILVKDEPGELEMTVSRIYGLEDISISCVLQLVPKQYQRKPEVGEDPEARKKMLQLSISITKDGAYPVLKIKCECYRDGFAIHQVDMEFEDEDQSVYHPYFSASKAQLVNNFQIFLYERGLNSDLAKYMEMHLESKRLLKSTIVIEKMTRFLVKDFTHSSCDQS